MRTVYISDTYISLSDRNGKKIFSSHIDKGIIINGFIADLESFTEYVKELKNKNGNHDVSIVLDTNSVLFKAVKVPKSLKKNNLHMYAAEELKSMSDSKAEYIYRGVYATIKTQKYILCGGFEKSMVNTYVQIFSSFNIKVKDFESTNMVFLNTILSKAKYINDLIIHINYDTLNMFIVNENQIFISRTRIPYDIDSEEFSSYIIENISRFFKSSIVNKLSQDITIIGAKEDLLENLKKSFINSKISELSINFNYNDIAKHTKDKYQLNFVKNIKISKKSSSKTISIMSTILVLSLILCGLGAQGIYTLEKYSENEYMKVKNDFEELSKSEELETYTLLNQELNLSRIDNKNIEDILSYLDIRKNNSGENLVKISQILQNYDCVLKNSNYNKSTSSLNIVFIGESSDDAIKVITAIDNLKIFDKINYLSKYRDVDNKYYFSIDCRG